MPYWADDIETLRALAIERNLVEPLEEADKITLVALLEQYDYMRDHPSDEPPKGWQTVEEGGQTFLRHAGTGEEKPMWPCKSEALRAMHNARAPARAEARRVEARAMMKKYGGARTKKGDPNRTRKPPVDNWRKCDAMRYGKACKKWQKLRNRESNFLYRPYRCRECAAANFDTDPNFKPVGPDGE